MKKSEKLILMAIVAIVVLFGSFQLLSIGPSEGYFALNGVQMQSSDSLSINDTALDIAFYYTPIITNIIKNPSLETQPSIADWYEYSTDPNCIFIWDNTTAYTGSYSGLLNCPTGSVGGMIVRQQLTKEIDVSEGEILELSCWYMGAPTRFGVTFMDGSYGHLADFFIYNLPSVPSWTQSQIIVVASPTGTTWDSVAYIQVGFYQEVEGMAWFDEVNMHEQKGVTSAEAIIRLDGNIIENVTLTETTDRWQATYVFPQNETYLLEGYATELSGEQTKLTSVWITVGTISPPEEPPPEEPPPEEPPPEEPPPEEPPPEEPPPTQPLDTNILLGAIIIGSVAITAATIYKRRR